ncbi:hypothetical protein BKA62DRAFT_765290 [Auriculariales sp. MPI-PUGE-AT-0066]|nr:hypothetical protein BKA62DRAFT_765290 [Auriculariales sp. MPI-PUGE-AT-0066]
MARGTSSLLWKILDRSNIITIVSCALFGLYTQSACVAASLAAAVVATLSAKFIKRFVRQPRPTLSGKKTYGFVVDFDIDSRSNRSQHAQLAFDSELVPVYDPFARVAFTTASQKPSTVTPRPGVRNYGHARMDNRCVPVTHSARASYY